MVVPDVIPEGSSSDVLVLSWVEGERLTDSSAADVRQLCNTLLSAYLHQVGIEGGESCCWWKAWWLGVAEAAVRLLRWCFFPACSSVRSLHQWSYLPCSCCVSVAHHRAFVLCATTFQLCDTGLLHADPHPGNLLRTTDGRIAIVSGRDCGPGGYVVACFTCQGWVGGARLWRSTVFRALLSLPSSLLLPPLLPPHPALAHPSPSLLSYLNSWTTA